MAALFALGVMSLVVDGVRRRADRRREDCCRGDVSPRSGSATLLLALAILMFAAPHALPGLTIPSGSMSGTMTM